MDISRRTFIGALGGGLGSVGLASAAKMNNQTSTPGGSQNEVNENDKNEKDEDEKGEDGKEDNENDKNEKDGDEKDGDEKGKDEKEDNENDESEKDEKSFTQSDVKLAPADAKQTATSTVSGSVSSVSLENRDGSPVYQVIVKPNSSPAKQVTVNANTGAVVKTESGSED